MLFMYYYHIKDRSNVTNQYYLLRLHYYYILHKYTRRYNLSVVIVLCVDGICFGQHACLFVSGNLLGLKTGNKCKQQLYEFKKQFFHLNNYLMYNINYITDVNASSVYKTE